MRDAHGQPETVAYHLLPSLLLNEYQKQQVTLAEVSARAEQDRAHLRDALAARDQELAALRTQRDKELAEMRAEMTALRQVTQQLMATIPNAMTVGMAAQ